MINLSVNIVSVIAAGVAAMVIGFIWYGPLFGKKWLSLMGMKESTMDNKKKMPMMALAGLVAAIITAWILAAFMQAAYVVTLDGALMVAFFVWLGFQATITIGSVLWEGKSVSLFVLNAAHQLVSLLVMATVLLVFST
ncbi:MAG TPA: DUF1761 domain-containing protein [archaeon]|nr:DUF1761 domain-containing protein [archaeon]